MSKLPGPLLCCILLTLKERLGEGLLLSCSMTFGQVRFTCRVGGAVLECGAVWPSTSSRTFRSVSSTSWKGKNILQDAVFHSGAAYPLHCLCYHADY